MRSLVVIDRQRRTRRELCSLLATRYTVFGVRNIRGVSKLLRKRRPDLLLVNTAAQDGIAIAVLRWIQLFGIQIPTIVLAGRGAAREALLAQRLEASAVLNWPTPFARLLEAIESLGAAKPSPVASTPMITADEAQTNLTLLEQRLNREMKCFAGKNKVYIQSVIVGNGLTTKPRVSLKCPLRAEFGLTPNVYYEYIREHCCGCPEECPAVRIFRERQHERDSSAGGSAAP
jgi:DNA-binding NarL/FixJ family response regulator